MSTGTNPDEGKGVAGTSTPTPKPKTKAAPSMEQKEIESLKKQMKATNDNVNALVDLVKDIASHDTPAPTRARDQVTTTPAPETPIDATEKVSIDFDAQGNVVITDKASLDPQDAGELIKEYNAEMGFMGEKLKIRIAPARDATARKVIAVGVNGRTMLLRAGSVVELPRAFVANMIESMEWTYSSEEREENKKGHENTFRYPLHSSPTVEFSVVEDTAEGHAWAQDFQQKCAMEALGGRQVSLTA